RRGDVGAHRRRRHRGGSPRRRGPARRAPFVTRAEASRRPLVLGVILGAQTIANVGPLGIPAIASLIRVDLGLTLTQAGSFLSAYYVGPILMSLPAGTLADRWGVKRIIVIGQVVIALGL